MNFHTFYETSPEVRSRKKKEFNSKLRLFTRGDSFGKSFASVRRRAISLDREKSTTVDDEESSVESAEFAGGEWQKRRRGDFGGRRRGRGPLMGICETAVMLSGNVRDALNVSLEC